MLLDFSEREQRFLKALGLLSGLTLALFLVRVLLTSSSYYLFIPGNLALAWLGLVFGWLLIRQLEATRWRSWQNLALSFLWLFFLPNTWYLLTDFIHLRATGDISELYDIVMLGSMVLCGFALGFTSLFIVHKELLRRYSPTVSGWLITGVILLSSFGIYLGRNLRWNSWDVVANPGGLIINVSDRLIDPLGHLRAFNVTGLFFVLILVVYWAFWILFKPTSKK